MKYENLYAKVERVVEKNSGMRDYELERFEEEDSVILHCGRGLLHTSITKKLYRNDQIIVTATWESDDYPLAVSFSHVEHPKSGLSKKPEGENQ